MVVSTPSLPSSRSTALGSALLAGSAVGLFGWDINEPETFAEVNTNGHADFVPKLGVMEGKGGGRVGGGEEPWFG